MTNKLVYILVIIHIFLPLNPIFAADDIDSLQIKNFDIDEVNRFASRKDPFLSGFLSSVMPGVGQIYSEEYTKGSLIILGDFLGKAAIATLMVSLSNKYTSGTNNSVGWERLNGGDKSLFLSVTILYLGFYIWNIVDAGDSASEYNAKYFTEPSLNITFETSKDNFKIGIQTLF